MQEATMTVKALIVKWAKKPDPRDVKSVVTSYVVTGLVLMATAFTVAVVKEWRSGSFSWRDVWISVTPVALGTLVGIAGLAIVHVARVCRNHPRHHH